MSDPLTTDLVTMDPELKARWLEALRSGRYVQGTGQLRFNGEHCCLGVLCDVVNPDGWRSDDEYAYGADEDEDSEMSTLPFGLRLEAGIPNEVETALISMNDENGATFAEIAEYIEGTL